MLWGNLDLHLLPLQTNLFPTPGRVTDVLIEPASSRPYPVIFPTCRRGGTGGPRSAGNGLPDFPPVSPSANGGEGETTRNQRFTFVLIQPASSRPYHHCGWINSSVGNDRSINRKIRSISRKINFAHKKFLPSGRRWVKTV
jgi:hypothetical protein